ncbi:hypothetical protein EI94DRAFT_1730674 [Lactarius quietus]|nr:hypothetical protein EI94DRAFT_1730674 [Lactarius quietus]
MDPPHQAYSSRECERQAIDAEIKSLEESIRALKRRRNALSPILFLPTEIITIVFSYFRLPAGVSTISSLPDEVIQDLFWSCRLPGMPPLGRSPDHHLAWLRVAHVCHQWREIALNYPLFWSHVDFTNLTLAGGPEILARAKEAPLHLEARFRTSDWGDTRFNAFEKEIQSRVSQICYLSISAGSFRLQKMIGGLTSPAPTLECLSLAQLPPIASSWRVSVHDTLFGGTTPRLTSLQLRNCDFSWKSPLLKGLRCLDARTESGSAKPNLADWLDALREMPHLEKLVLHSVSPNYLHSPFTYDINRVVSLPSLTHLDISANARSCARALSYLFLPALTKLRVTLASTNGGNMQDVFLSLSQHANGPQDIEPLQSVLISGERNCANILAWPMPDLDVDSHDPFALLSVALSARVALSITSDRYTRDQDLLLDSAMAALPLGSILTLTAEHRSFLDDQFWLRNAPKWHLLQCARLALSEARGFIEMLLEDTGGREYPVLPSLTMLVLLDIPLSGRRTQRLCDALMKRVEQGVPLETLDLHTCRATTFAVQLLSELVVEVWGPAEASEAKEFVSWGPAVRVPFVPECDDSSGPEDYSDYDDDDSPASDYDEEWGDEGIDVEMEDGEEGEDYYSDMGAD